MKYIAGVLVTILLALTLPFCAAAIQTIPSSPSTTDGPFVISGYSFQGKSLRYVQVANTSSSVVSLDGWKVAIDLPGSGMMVVVELTGMVAPLKKIIVADSVAVSGATINFQQQQPSALDGRILSVNLLAPIGSGLNSSVATPSINDSTGSSRTPRDETATPSAFYFARNVSSATGNYLSSYSAFVPNTDFRLEADPLYAWPAESPLRLVEIYPKPPTCSPFDQSPLCLDYVKLVNVSSETIVLSDFRVRTGSLGSATSSNTTQLPNNGLKSGEYFAVGLNLIDSGGWVWLEDTYGLKRYVETSIDYPSATSQVGEAWTYSDANNAWQWTRYPTPSNMPNDFGPVVRYNDCQYLRLSEVAANVTNQFIEIYNSGGSSIDISGCIIQTNRSDTDQYVFSEGESLGTGEYRVIQLEGSGLVLTKTTSGTVYLLSSDGRIEVDARSYENLDSDSSLSLIGGSWMQTFTLTPGLPNQYAKYLPCQTDYERNEATGMCRKIAEVASLAACGLGEYRNAETNRCRSFSSSSSGSAMALCASNQFRNPETNRCKSSVSTASALVPCAPGQVRNLTTNRCRKDTSLSIPGADYAVEKTPGSTQSSLGWLAFAGVGALAFGYAVWEWRKELAGVGSRARSLFSRGK